MGESKFKARRKQKLTIGSSALISNCGTYRYNLYRIWDYEKPLLNFIMLNPSTADGETDDPTIRKCIAWAKALGFGGLVVTNLFAYRSTDPKNLSHAVNPIGSDNDEILIRIAKKAGMVICAWGNSGKLFVRGIYVKRLLQREGIKLYALKISNEGYPCHPLYLSYDLKPQEYK